MFYYNLISCNSALYPNLGPFWHKVQHSYSNQLVIIGIDVSKHYTLTPLGGSEQSISALPFLNLSPYTACALAEHYYLVKSCSTGEYRAYLFPTAQTVDDVVKFAGECDTWQIDDYEGQTLNGLAPAIEATYDSCSTGLQSLQYLTCQFGEVTDSYALGVKIPTQADVDRDFDCCFFEQKVLASSSSTDAHKNDYTGFYYKKQTNSDTISFKLVKLLDNTETTLSDTYGELKVTGAVTTMRLDWKAVLTDAVLGAGTYQVKQEINVAGQTTEILSNTFRLYEYSDAIADKTVRFDAVINGKYENLGIDFNSYKTSMRLPGFFGRANPKYTQDNIIHSDYTSRQVSISVQNEYSFQSNLLPSCITEELLYFVLLADSLKATDYNANNHDYNIIELPVVLSESSDPSYYVRTRKAKLNLTFADKIKNILKRNC